MPSFLATYSLKVSIYAQYFSAKFFYVAIYWACKCSLVIVSIQNYPLKPETRVKSCFAPNKSKKGTFFFSKLWLVIFRPIRERIWKKQLEHRSQRPVTSQALLICDFPTKQWQFDAKMYHIYGKKVSMYLPRYEKKHCSLIDLSKLS